MSLHLSRGERRNTLLETFLRSALPPKATIIAVVCANIVGLRIATVIWQDGDARGSMEFHGSVSRLWDCLRARHESLVFALVGIRRETYENKRNQFTKGNKATSEKVGEGTLQFVPGIVCIRRCTGKARNSAMFKMVVIGDARYRLLVAPWFAVLYSLSELTALVHTDKCRLRRY